MKQPKNTVDRQKGMKRSKLGTLCRLIASNGFEEILEIGMTYGSSSVAILSTLSSGKCGSLVSIDRIFLIVKQGKNLKSILTDASHSFDRAFLNFCCKNLLLRRGRIVAFHDTVASDAYRQM